MHLNSFSDATRYSLRFYFFFLFLWFQIYLNELPFRQYLFYTKTFTAFSCKWVQLEILFQYGELMCCGFFCEGKSWWDKYLCEINRHLSCLWCLIVYIAGIHLFSSTKELVQSNNQMKDIKIAIFFPKGVIQLKARGKGKYNA